MSSAATAGPPPTRPDPKNTGEPASVLRTHNGVLLGDSYGSRSANRIFPHIDDLVAAKPDVSVYTPIRKLLLQGESHSKQAETHIDFRRPDIGLEEYIKACTIVVDIIPRHKEYPELKSDRGDLHRLYTGLQKRINNQNEKFEEVKKIIKENNARSGVKPTLLSDTSVNSTLKGGMERSRTPPLSVYDRSTENDSPERSEIAQSGGGNKQPNKIPTLHLSSTHDANTLPTRQKPPVQPKPEALHGRTINHSPGRSPEPALKEDLQTRFARLRGPEPRVQDPRIRTHPIKIPDTAISLAKNVPSPLPSTLGGTPQARPDRPFAPRDMPKVPSGPLRLPKLPIDVQIPSMPRPPDAVYSPSRNLNSPTNIDMPQSASRTLGVAGRSSSGNSTNSILHRSNSSDDRQNGYSSPIRKPSDVSADPKSSRPYIKGSATVTAEELMEYLKRGFHELSILLVDIRERENFDSGHILSHSIICIEPIILRSGISAEELSQSLVLSPEAEKKAFDKRDTFDLVIYYDQSSSSISSSSFTSHGDEVALHHFSKAVYDYGYDKQLKRRPMLLAGGLDSWTDLMGSGALQASQTATTKPNGTFIMGNKTYESRPLSADEEERCNKALEGEGEGEGEDETESFSFVRTTEEFFRRFPEPSAIQESMISPENGPDSQINRIRRVDIPLAPISISKQEKIDWALPQIPTRPAPALPRQSYSGISGRIGLNASIDQQSACSVVDSISERPVPPRPCGLTNGSNFCYMNATIQALRATGPFREFFIGGGLLKLGPPPRKGAEMADPPQLMARNFANVLEQLSSGQKPRLEPKRFRAYVVSVQGASDEYPREVFDGKYQQDASEFLMFLLTVLTDETNMMRHKKPLLALTMEQESFRAKLPIAQASLMEWDRFLHNTRSPISQLIYGQIVYEMNCQSCGYVSKTWQHWPIFVINIPDDVRDPNSVPLTHLLKDAFNPYQVDYWCEYSCKRKGKIAMTKGSLSRCPDVMIMQINRTMYGADGQYGKVNTKVTFDLDHLDMTPYFIPLDGVDPEQLDETCRPPFIYQCNAVIQHVGARLTVGHYWTLSRVPGRREWLNYNDTDVYPVDPRETQSKSSYILIYQRKNRVGIS